ncbi:hypothetical protein VB636_17965, partial [Paracoccus sp. APAP_BH8]
MRFRQALGLICFAYVACHLAAWVVFDMAFLHGVPIPGPLAWLTGFWNLCFQTVTSSLIPHVHWPLCRHGVQQPAAPVVIGNHPFRTAQAPVGEPAQELRPEGLRLGRAVGQGRI